MESTSSSSEYGLRSANQIYMLGNPINEILGSKLPSKRQVLQLMISHLIAPKSKPYDAALKTAYSVIKFWEAVEIAIMSPHNSANKMVKLYEAYKYLEKSSKNRLQKNTELFKQRENSFQDDLDDLFDIASSDLGTTSEEAKIFLMQQRLKGRPGNITFKFATEKRSEQPAELGNE